MTTPPDPPTPPPADAGLATRVGALETGQTSILEKLDSLLGFMDKEPPAEAEQPAVSIADEIRRQLADRDKKAPKVKEAPAAAPAQLAEQAPKAPVRKITNWLWGNE